MNDIVNQQLPGTYSNIEEATTAIGFNMASGILTCSLLRTLASIKHGGRLLELGTGTGLSTSWILDGMDDNATLISVDNNEELLGIAEKFLGTDARLTLVHSDGGEWLTQNQHLRFDYIFADTWHGKYLLLEETIAMLNKGGIYIIDDMLPQVNWPEGHKEKVQNLIEQLENRQDLLLTKQSWASGIILAVKR